MLLFLWFLAGLIASSVFAYIFMWRGEEVFEVTGMSVLLYFTFACLGGLALLLVLLWIIIEIVESEAFNRLFDKKLFTYEKKK